MAAREDVENAIKIALTTTAVTSTSLVDKQAIIRSVKVELDKLVKSKSIDNYLIGYADALTISYQKDMTVATMQAKHTFEIIDMAEKITSLESQVQGS